MINKNEGLLAKHLLKLRKLEVAYKIAKICLVAVISIFFIANVDAPAITGGNAAKEHVAYVEVYGPIMTGQAADAGTLLPAIEAAFKAEGSKAVALVINSPGGSPVQAGLIYQELNKLKEEHSKPLYAVIEDLGASAAYYIASAADEIIVDQASMVGSIGVISSGFGFTDVMEKVGVERRVITAGKNKAFMDSFLPSDPHIQDYWKDLLNEVHDQFKTAVVTGRGDRLDAEYPGVFSGLVWTGAKSVEIGLADELGSMLSVSRDTLGGEVNNVNYTPTPDVFKILTNNANAALSNILVTQQQPQFH